jgi:hypothetical protein
MKTPRIRKGPGECPNASARTEGVPSGPPLFEEPVPVPGPVGDRQLVVIGQVLGEGCQQGASKSSRTSTTLRRERDSNPLGAASQGLSRPSRVVSRISRGGSELGFLSFVVVLVGSN